MAPDPSPEPVASPRSTDGAPSGSGAAPTRSGTRLRTRAWEDGRAVAAGFPLADVSDHLAVDGRLVWIDLVDPDEDDFAALEDEIGPHELAVEDALHDGQRPKVDRYRDHLFTALYDVELDRTSGEVATDEVKAIVTHRALVTVHHDGFDVDRLEKAWDDSPDLAGHGVAWLLWGLLDRVADRQHACVDALDDELEALDDDLFDPARHGLDVQRRSFALRQGLVRLRRVCVPMPDLLASIVRDEHAGARGDLQPYLRDVEDHVLRTAQQADSLRDLVQTILDTDLALQSQRSNDVMKKVTSWAAVIAVPTAVTGFFGQNVPFPGSGQPWGAALSAGLVLGSSVALWIGFRRRDWL